MNCIFPKSIILLTALTTFSYPKRVTDSCLYLQDTWLPAFTIKLETKGRKDVLIKSINSHSLGTYLQMIINMCQCSWWNMNSLQFQNDYLQPSLIQSMICRAHNYLYEQGALKWHFQSPRPKSQNEPPRHCHLWSQHILSKRETIVLDGLLCLTARSDKFKHYWNDSSVFHISIIVLLLRHWRCIYLFNHIYLYWGWALNTTRLKAAGLLRTFLRYVKSCSNIYSLKQEFVQSIISSI